MFSVKLLLVSLAVASQAYASTSVPAPKDLNTSDTSAVPAATPPAALSTPPGNDVTNKTMSVPSPAANATDSPVAAPANRSSAMIPGDMSSGNCMCSPPPPTPLCPATPQSPPSTPSGSVVSPTTSSPATPASNETTPPAASGDNSTSSAVTNTVSLLGLVTAGALAVVF